MQPLSHVKPNARIRRDINTMLRYPNITAGIALCISTHSEIELDLGILLSALLRAETNATLAIYSSLENRAAHSDPAGRAAEFGTLKRPATLWLWPIFKAHLPAIKDRLRKLALAPL